MERFSIAVHVLSGAKIEFTVESSELVSSLKLRVEEAVGVSELQEVKLYKETEEVCLDATISESLQPGAVVIAVVVSSLRKTRKVVQECMSSVSILLPYKVLSQIRRTSPEIRSIFSEPLPTEVISEAAHLRSHERKLQELTFAHDWEFLADVEQKDLSIMLKDLWRQDPSHWYWCGPTLLLGLWVSSGYSQAIMRELSDLVRSRKYPLFDNESACWIQVIEASASYSWGESESILCTLASCHGQPEVRAAALHSFGCAPAWALRHLPQLQEISRRQCIARHESEIHAAATAVRALQRQLPPNPVVGKAPAVVGPPLRVDMRMQGRVGVPVKAPPPVKAVPPAGPLLEETETEPGLEEALQLSEQDAMQKEQQDVQEALLRSKESALSQEGVTLFRLTFHNPHVISAILTSPELEGCRSRVESSGCSIQPDWANAALLLVPATQEQIEEARIQLKPHNILMLDSERALLESCLTKLSRRKRPQLKLEQYPVGCIQMQPAPNAENSNEEEKGTSSEMHDFTATGVPEGWADLGLVVERTFLSFPVEREVSDASTIVHSAPAPGETPNRHVNPHQWRLPPPLSDLV
eukprot:TRINITY_DN36419_c0_g1_i1.p1 TRINITY_DN36419_c0_g1~~TRINITY_DN36419_c0_g1_i1.p1  ORF type:complete len:584 (+),score=113.31 TRINITY_DN36419_c0_g1_i1:43-1794(+)